MPLCNESRLAGYNPAVPDLMKMKSLSAVLVSLAFVSPCSAIDYVSEVLPIMKEHCWSCHSNEEKVKGNLALDDFDEVRDYQIGPYNIIVPGKPDESSFLEKMKLPAGHSDFMPAKGDPVPEKELAVIEKWIAAGAIVDAKKPSEREQKFLSQGEAVSMEDERQKFHTWTNSEGRSIEARFVRLVDDSVTVVMENGKSYAIPLASLGSESKELAKKLSEAGR